MNSEFLFKILVRYVSGGKRATEKSFDLLFSHCEFGQTFNSITVVQFCREKGLKFLSNISPLKIEFFPLSTFTLFSFVYIEKSSVRLIEIEIVIGVRNWLCIAMVKE